MSGLTNKRVILWDFDGVISDSNQVRKFGFEEIFKDFPAEEVSKLLIFHNKNGGLSRYVKIRYFYEVLLGTSITESEVLELAHAFSSIMKEELIKPEYLIRDAIDFIKDNYQKYEMHIVSGSDQNELRFLCKSLGIDTYFKTINGSPTHKNALVANLLKTYHYAKEDVILIGDSINDYEAASLNNITFSGYNNTALEEKGNYIRQFIC
ncbi:MAG: HAD family hydrolase [Cyclobacteriaceae bacterium]|nr:HAD family hydrolase [Cyclobacteriaceae bacterium]